MQIFCQRNSTLLIKRRSMVPKTMKMILIFALGATAVLAEVLSSSEVVVKKVDDKVKVVTKTRTKSDDPNSDAKASVVVVVDMEDCYAKVDQGVVSLVEEYCDEMIVDAFAEAYADGELRDVAKTYTWAKQHDCSSEAFAKTIVKMYGCN
eukprot:TRINITY_DN10080_c1_g2_i3.p5 TRINITY_DN10080_c1_g2~~TRINITY_DN10080_c1_g2_i3.p5  ORF type:complete len:150 (+),score=25.57 TRINITY_DN10080_c1_g2_i3:84-533(+)